MLGLRAYWACCICRWNQEKHLALASVARRPYHGRGLNFAHYERRIFRVSICAENARNALQSRPPYSAAYSAHWSAPLAKHLICCRCLPFMSFGAIVCTSTRWHTLIVSTCVGSFAQRARSLVGAQCAYGTRLYGRTLVGFNEIPCFRRRFHVHFRLCRFLLRPRCLSRFFCAQARRNAEK